MDDSTATAYDVWFTEDPAAFLAVTEEHLPLDPVLTTVVSSLTHRVLRERERGAGRPDHPQWWAVVRDAGGSIAGVAMRTAPFVPCPEDVPSSVELRWRSGEHQAALTS